MNGLKNGLQEGLTSGLNNGLAEGLTNGLTNGLFVNEYSFDIDANKFLLAANINDIRIKNAINKLVINLKAANIWTKMKAVYPMVGGTATAHKFNLKNPTDTNAAFRLNFVGGWTHSATGATPNGTNGWANTFFAPGTIGMNTSSFHMSYYSRNLSSSGTSRALFAVTNGTNVSDNLTALVWGNGGTQELGTIAGRLSGAEYSPTTSVANYMGLKMINTSGSRSAKYFKNGAFISNSVTQTGAFDSYPIYMSAVNRYNTSIDAYNNQESAFASIGDGLSDAEALSLYNAVQKFQTSLSRQV